MAAKGSKRRSLLEKIKIGKVEDLHKFLEENKEIDINKEDKARQYPLKLAVQLKNKDMVAEILKIENVDLKDSFLHAINTKDFSIIKMIHEKMEGQVHSKDFPAYIVEQPLILACHNNDYHTIEFLMSKEYLTSEGGPKDQSNKIKIPKGIQKIEGKWYANWWRASLFRKPYGSSDTDNRQIKEKRELLDKLRAAASPVYICLCSMEDSEGNIKKPDDKRKDLFLEIFKLCKSADFYKQEYPLYETEYKKIRKDLDAFAVKLLDECQEQEDVECILKKAGKKEDEQIEVLLSRGRYQRLKLAMQYEMKEVIAHRNCQQVLEDMWTGGNHKLMQANMWTWLCFYLPRLFLLPFIYLVLFIYPETFTSKDEQKNSKKNEETKPKLYWKTPIAKFSSDMISYCIFLILLAVDVGTTPRESLGQRAPGLNGGLDVVIFLYMFSFIWDGIESIWQHGKWIVFTNWWMLHLWVMNIFSFTYMLTRLISYIMTLYEDPSYVDEERYLWHWLDVMLWSAAAYSYFIVLAFIKILYIFQDSKAFGPLQLSLAKMILEISKTLLIYFVILVSFTFGMSRLYDYYSGMKEEDVFGEVLEQPAAFSSLYDSLLYLFWLLLGQGSPENADVIVNNYCPNNTGLVCYPPNEHQLTESAGYLLYVIYQLIGGIILMRMLIALMSSALKAIQDKEDTEWKFSRARLWLTYFEQRSIFPNPLNVIPSPWGIYQSFVWCFSCKKKRKKGYKDCCYPSVPGPTKEVIGKNDEKYWELTDRLATAYLSDVEEKKNLERSQVQPATQLMKRVAEKWANVAGNRALERRLSQEPIQEEPTSSTKMMSLGAVKNSTNKQNPSPRKEGRRKNNPEVHQEVATTESIQLHDRSNDSERGHDNEAFSDDSSEQSEADC